MDLQPGDWVKTESGEVGKVVQISRLTVFVAVPQPGQADRMLALLESELSKTNPPTKRGTRAGDS
jgi:hypothetical protein